MLSLSGCAGSYGVSSPFSLDKTNSVSWNTSWIYVLSKMGLKLLLKSSRSKSVLRRQFSWF